MKKSMFWETPYGAIVGTLVFWISLVAIISAATFFFALLYYFITLDSVVFYTLCKALNPLEHMWIRVVMLIFIVFAFFGWKFRNGI